jgi:hypothetical protein
MPVVAVFESPGFTQENYEESVRRIAGKSQLESPGDWPVPGLLAHVAGQGQNGFRVVDVWDSQESFDSFGATLLPILQEIGVEGQPEVYSTHTYVAA